ncbi:MAG TPA: hypothetical protein VM536_19005 [Chloroflexia bacterium]|nr:hypothetical protein [Chloroflexia bacterium]
MNHWTHHHLGRAGPRHRRAAPHAVDRHRDRARRTARSLAVATRAAVGALTGPLPRRFARAYLAWLAGRRPYPDPQCWDLTHDEHADILGGLPG